MTEGGCNAAGSLIVAAERAKIKQGYEGQTSCLPRTQLWQTGMSAPRAALRGAGRRR